MNSERQAGHEGLRKTRGEEERRRGAEEQRLLLL